MKLNFRQSLSDKFIRGTFWLTAVSFISSAFNYFVHPILTRHLTIAEYGDFQALLSFATIIGIIGAVVATVLTKEISLLNTARPEEINALRRRASSRLLFVGLAVLALIIIFSGPLNNLFKISEPAVLVISSLSLLYIFSLVVNRATLTGVQAFSALSLSNLLDAVGRLALVILLVVIFPWGLLGAAYSLSFASLAAFLISFWQIKKLKLPAAVAGFKPSLRTMWRYALLVLWFTALYQFFYNFDMLLVKSFFSPEEAGLYGALLTIGRIIYFVGGSIPLVMFPVLAGLQGDKSSRRYKVLGKSLLLMSGLTIPAYLIISLWPEFIIRIVVGVKYLSIAPYLPGFALVMLFLTLLMVLSQYFLALAKRRGLVVLTLAALGEIILLMFWHDNIFEIIRSLGLVFGGASLALIILLVSDFRRARALERKYE
ncbi:MAG: oligosaccharide flippase family protein [Candidatus Falkowbacteria bacterium]|nr:oligosaccharide flippase family protein [Candidatus Falkowbacteria bacterium]